MGLPSAFGSRPDHAETRYADMRAAGDDGAVGRGWLPRFIPDSAFQIIERHNRKTNQIWLSFEIPKGDESSLLKEESDRTQFLPIRRCEMPHKMAGAKFRRVGFLAIDLMGEKVWYWE